MDDIRNVEVGSSDNMYTSSNGWFHEYICLCQPMKQWCNIGTYRLPNRRPGKLTYWNLLLVNHFPTSCQVNPSIYTANPRMQGSLLPTHTRCLFPAVTMSASRMSAKRSASEQLFQTKSYLLHPSSRTVTVSSPHTKVHASLKVSGWSSSS